jgi:hypothetical protein
MENHKVQCTAKSKQSGKRCKRLAVGGRTVCYIHGGAAPLRAGGAFQKLHSDLLTDDEKAVFNDAPTDPITVTENALKLLQVKAYRIQKKLMLLGVSGRKMDSSWFMDYVTAGKVASNTATLTELTAIADMSERRELGADPEKDKQITAYERGWVNVMDQIRRMSYNLYRMRNPIQSQINVVGQVVTGGASERLTGGQQVSISAPGQTSLPASHQPLSIEAIETGKESCPVIKRGDKEPEETLTTPVVV